MTVKKLRKQLKKIQDQTEGVMVEVYVERLHAWVMAPVESISLTVGNSPANVMLTGKRPPPLLSVTYEDPEYAPNDPRARFAYDGS
jgi:hypothetical protein